MVSSSELRTGALLCHILLVCSHVLCIVREADAIVEERSVQVVVNTSKVVNVIDDDTFLCVTLDWWPSTKCNYGRCSWGQAGLLTLDLENPILTRALQALTPVTVRAGGTLQNLIVYDIGEQIASEACRPFVYNESALYNYSGGCLPLQRWDALNAFWTKAGVTSVAFGLNNLYGRSKERADYNATGPWITKNTYNFIKYTVEKGYPITGWELGNELLGFGIEKEILAEDYAHDAKRFKRIVDELYPPPLKKPLIIAPDFIYFVGDTEISKFLEDSGPAVVDVVTRHSYNLGSGATDPDQLIANILSNSVAQEETTLYEGLNEVLLDKPETVAWVGEAGGAFNSGGNGVTNAYIMAFWYMDQLGKAAVLKNQAFCRQSLVGGFYGLLDTDTFVPNPDYYGTLLWRKLMGKVVFDVDVNGTDEIRAYGHSRRNQTRGLTLLIINYSKSTKYCLSVDFLRASTYRGVRHEYHMSAPSGNLTSKVVMLNGHPLELTASGNIPEVLPRKIDSSSPISIDPLTYAFIVFGNVNVPAGTYTAVRMSRSKENF